MDIIKILSSSEFWSTVTTIAWAVIVGVGSVLIRKFGTEAKKNKKNIKQIDTKFSELETINSDLKVQNEQLHTTLIRVNENYTDLEELLSSTKAFYIQKLSGIMEALQKCETENKSFKDALEIVKQQANEHNIPPKP